MKKTELIKIIKEEIQKALMDKDIQKLLKTNEKIAKETLTDAKETIDNVTVTDAGKNVKYTEGEGWNSKKSK